MHYFSEAMPKLDNQGSIQVETDKPITYYARKY